jgi:formylglycine-generating enzyme required for sulfatase activity
MLGNVWEWVDHPARLEPNEFQQFAKLHPELAPPLSPEEPAYRIRGGSFQVFLPREDRKRLAYEFAVMPARLKGPDLGFRCARDVPK